MKKTITGLILFLIITSPLTYTLIPTIKSTTQAIKDLIHKDLVLQDLFSGQETPDEILKKSRTAILLTRFPTIAQELEENLNPTLETLLHGTETRSSLQHGNHQQPVARCTHEEEIARLKEEISKLRSSEKSRLDEDISTLTTQVAQIKQEISNYSSLNTETKERIISLRHELQRLGIAANKVHAPLIVNTQIENMLAFFSQQIANIERRQTEMANHLEQLQQLTDSLTWALQRHSSDLTEAQDRAKEAWLYFKRIKRTIEELQQIAVLISDAKTLAMQTKFDLERRCEAETKTTSHRKRR